MRVAVPSRVVEPGEAAERIRGFTPLATVWMPFKITKYVLMTGKGEDERRLCIASCANHVERDENILFLLRSYYLKDRVKYLELPREARVAPDEDLDIMVILSRLKSLVAAMGSRLRYPRCTVRTTVWQRLGWVLMTSPKAHEVSISEAVTTYGIVKGLVLDHLGLKHDVIEARSLGTIYVPFVYGRIGGEPVVVESYGKVKIDKGLSRLMRSDEGFSSFMLRLLAPPYEE